jgi:hypothetical protein
LRSDGLYGLTMASLRAELVAGQLVKRIASMIEIALGGVIGQLERIFERGQRSHVTEGDCRWLAISRRHSDEVVCDS